MSAGPGRRIVLPKVRTRSPAGCESRKAEWASVAECDPNGRAHPQRRVLERILTERPQFVRERRSVDLNEGHIRISLAHGRDQVAEGFVRSASDAVASASVPEWP